jgi:hypothetical protein
MQHRPGLLDGFMTEDLDNKERLGDTRTAVRLPAWLRRLERAVRD